MSTIKQRSKSVRIGIEGERTIEVRRLTWKPASEFIKQIVGVVAAFMAAGNSGDAAFKQIATIVVGSDDLIRVLLTGATELKPEDIDALDYGDVLRLIDAAIEINLDEETKNSSAGIVEKVKAFVVVSPKTS
jgi:hypothetical protein